MSHHDPAVVRTRLAQIGQEHLLAFYRSLTAEQQQSLLAQIEAIDLASVPGWVKTYVTSKPAPTIPTDLSRIAPAPYYPFDTAGPRGYDASRFRQAGEELLRAGKVAAFVVAGGQGSRLGFEGPKGCYPATPITRKTLFHVFAEQLLAATRRYGRPIPWAVMTSPLNHAATVAYFEQHRFFGLGEENVMFFPQGVMPSFDLSSGKILLASPHEIATNPDGHGGAVSALHKSGTLGKLASRGIEHLSYFQVDNPHVKIIDPLFLGLHAAAPDSSGEMSSKMIPKASWDEKVGVFCTIDGKLDVIEYSDMPAELARATKADGSLRFAAGSIAIHMISIAFLRRLATDQSVSLPFHRAEKKIPHVDLATGKAVSPTGNNGVKLERFIFDALSRAGKSIVLETERVEEFAPIKNATGTDSVESSQRLQTLRAARWLVRCGTKVPTRPDGQPDCVIELSPLSGCSPDDLACTRMPKEIEPGAQLIL